jgi:poly(A) polymerase
LVAALDALKTLLPPIHEYVDSQEPEGQTEYWRFVDAMDASVRKKGNFDDSMLLASILLPISLDEPEKGDAEEENGKPPSVAQAIEQLLSQLVQKARLPRRIAERCRMILMAQRTLAGLRRRRGGLMGFRGHPLFNEALAVFEVWVSATGEHQDQLEKWKSGAAPQPTSDAPGPRRRRRRRRRGGGGGGEAQGGSGGDAPAPQPSSPTPE